MYSVLHRRWINELTQIVHWFFGLVNLPEDKTKGLKLCSLRPTVRACNKKIVYYFRAISSESHFLLGYPRSLFRQIFVSCYFPLYTSNVQCVRLELQRCVLTLVIVRGFCSLQIKKSKKKYSHFCSILYFAYAPVLSF